MRASRDVDLTRNLDFQKEEPKLHSISIKQDGVEDYRRYNEYKQTPTESDWTRANTAISQWLQSDINFTTSTLSSITPLLPSTKKVEERVCWRKLYRDPDVYVTSYTPEEAVERMKQMNFALGSKQDRLNIQYEKDKMKFYHLECECCGRPIKYGYNCLNEFPDLCSGCAERFYKPMLNKVCWR